MERPPNNSQSNLPPFNPQGQFPPQGNLQQGYPQQPYNGPQQGYPQQPYQQPYGQPVPPPKKKRGRLALIIGGVIALLLFACIGTSVVMSSHGTSAVTSSSKVGNDTGSTPTAIPTQTNAYKVGDVVKVGDAWNVTVESAKASTGDTTFTPKSGMRYLVLSLSMKNLTSENHTVSSIAQFTLRSDDGTKYDIALYAPDGTTQIDGNVDGGQPAKGVIVYEVPVNVSSFHLNFDANPFDASSGRAAWNLTI